MGTKLLVSKFSECTKLRVITFSVFASLNMRFMPIRETNDTRYLAKSVDIFFIFYV